MSFHGRRAGGSSGATRRKMALYWNIRTTLLSDCGIPLVHGSELAEQSALASHTSAHEDDATAAFCVYTTTATLHEPARVQKRTRKGNIGYRYGTGPMTMERRHA